MRQLYTNLAAGTLLVLCFISHGHGAAVMSIDLGSEWMKVNYTCEMMQLYSADGNVINSFIADRRCVTGCAYGNCIKQRVEEEDSDCDSF